MRMFKKVMKYSNLTILIELFAITSYNFAKNLLVFNDCIDRTKLDYISKKGAAHIFLI